MSVTLRNNIVKSVRLGTDALLVADAGEGEVLASDTALSLWGGIDPASGFVIDQHHPLKGENLAGRVLVIPHGRGSCSGSVVFLEAVYAGCSPAVVLLNRPDAIIGLGAIVANEILHKTVPVAVLNDATFALAQRAQRIRLDADGTLTLWGDDNLNTLPVTAASTSPLHAKLELSEADQRRLAGAEGPAARAAMRIIVRMAQLQGANRLIDVTRTHIDGCIYTGPAGLAFAQQLVAWQGKVVVPTTLNAISVDRRRWRELGIPESNAKPAGDLAEAYVQLGAEPTFTCAPYLLDDLPARGENIAWAESNAVVYANSVLAARTDKTPDLLDACIALTGRAPLAGYYLDSERRGRVVVEVPEMEMLDEAIYPLLGYVVGNCVNSQVPVVTGLERGWTRDALKAFGAAFATTSSAGMYHIVGVTPEAPSLEAALTGHSPEQHLRLTHGDLQAAWTELNSDQEHEVDLVALGNPHFSSEEFAALAGLCAGRRKAEEVDVVVTTSRHIATQADSAGYLKTLDRFGVRLVTDACWCMLYEPVVRRSARVIVTNSAKYAHYGPGLVDRKVRFTNLQGCVEAAIKGSVSNTLPAWLVASQAGKFCS